jgi:hypothetical protein
MVEDIEAVYANMKICPAPVRYGEVAHYSQIQIALAWRSYRIPPHVSKSVWGRRDNAGRVEPLFLIPSSSFIWIADLIWKRRGAGVCRIGAKSRSERQSSLPVKNGRESKTSKNRRRYALI